MMEIKLPDEVIGLLSYDLTLPRCCDDCGRPIFNRMFLHAPSGCETCDAALTAHRCSGRPLAFEQPEGFEWTCQDCGSRYQVEVKTETVEHHRWELISAAVLDVPSTERCHRANGYTVHVKPGCRCGRWGP